MMFLVQTTLEIPTVNTILNCIDIELFTEIHGIFDNLITYCISAI